MTKRKSVKYSHAYKFYYFEIDAVFADIPVKLFFYRFGRKGIWKALLSTDTLLTPYKAYQTYSMRWSIEVCFHECKSLLNLGKCQCRDFGSQIAAISLNILQYNLLSYVKEVLNHTKQLVAYSVKLQQDCKNCPLLKKYGD